MHRIEPTDIRLPTVLKPEDSSAGPLNPYLDLVETNGRAALHGKAEEQFNRVVVDVLNRGLTEGRSQPETAKDNDDLGDLLAFLQQNTDFLKPIFVSQLEGLPARSLPLDAALGKLKKTPAYDGLQRSVAQSENRVALRISQEDKILPSDLPNPRSRTPHPTSTPKPAPPKPAPPKRDPAKASKRKPKSNVKKQPPAPPSEEIHSTLPLPPKELSLLKEQLAKLDLQGTSDHQLEKVILRSDGSLVVPQDGDGSCFFRSIADSLRFHRAALSDVLATKLVDQLDAPNLHEILRTNTVNRMETLLDKGESAEKRVDGLLRENGGYSAEQTPGNRNVLRRQILNLPLHNELRQDCEAAEEFLGQLKANLDEENESRARTLSEDLKSIALARTEIENPPPPQTSQSVAREMGFADKDKALESLASRESELQSTKAPLATVSDFLTASRSLNVCAASALTRGLSEILGGIPISIVARNDAAPKNEIEKMRFGAKNANLPLLCIGLKDLHYEPIFRP